MTLIAGACGPAAFGRAAAILTANEQAQSGPASFCAQSNGHGAAIWRDQHLMVVADARIDDRATLCRELGIADATLTDAALIGRAWRQWGEDAPLALIGDYGFAVFDGQNGGLWLVRDALGFRPLCFIADRDTAAFCSLPHPLRGPESAGIDRHRPGARTSPDSWFAGVEQVQPGERVRLDRGRPARTIWWQPSTRASFCGTREDLIEQASGALASAVADRIGGEARIATHLSAGLDSMAVTDVAARQMPDDGAVIAITARPVPGRAHVDPPGRMIDESDHAAAMAACYANIRHVVVDADGHGVAPALCGAATRFAEPLTNPANHGWTTASCEAALAGGARRLLIGQMGNYALSARAENYWWPLLRREGVWALWREFRHAPRRRAIGGEILRRMRGMAAPSAPARLRLIRTIDPGLFLKRIARDGVEMLDPTADRRVIELMLTVPDNLLLRGGDPRWLVRAMLRGRVPDAVLDEPRRGFQSADWLARLQAEAPELIAILEQAAGIDPGFARDTDVMRRIAAGFDPALDTPARTRIGSSLARAAFLIANPPVR